MASEDPNKKKQPELSELISLQQAAQLSGLSGSHLRLLVSTGALWGVKLGRNWFTTAQAVEKYLQAEHRPGPKAKQS